MSSEGEYRKFYWIKAEDGEYRPVSVWGWVPGNIEDFGHGPVGAFAGIEEENIPDGLYMVLVAKFYDTWGESHPIRTWLFEVVTRPAQTNYRPISQAEADHGAGNPGGVKWQSVRSNRG